MIQASHRFNEISNLRAFAVIAVLIYHFWSSAAPGGFIGVDIFFVLSGFVVAAAYFDRVATRDISIREFLWRRVRRLMPAAVVVVVATWLVALWRLEPNELLLLSQSLLSQVLYVQNVFFLVGGDYFHGELDKPLLHTWSLAVEEQFYLLFPLVAILSARLRRRLAVLVGLAVASMLLAVLAAQVSPKVAFFLLPTRAWEILVGMVCWTLQTQLQERVVVPRWLAAAGVGALVVAVFAFDKTAVFPDAQAFIAVGGTAAVLLTLRTDRRTRSVAVLDWLGERSYSLYLWHWPIYVFVVREAGVSVSRVFAVIVLALLMTELGYRLVEDPIRSRRMLKEQRSLALAMVASITLMIGLSTLTIATNGLPQRYPEPANHLFAQAIEQNHGRCGLVSRLTSPAAACHVGGDGPRGLLVIGDSHADAMDEQLAGLGATRGFRVYLADTSCDVWSLVGKVFRCGERYRESLLAFARAHTIDRVVLISAWSGLKEDRAREAIAALRAAGLVVVISGPLPAGIELDPAVHARRAMTSADYVAPTTIEIAEGNGQTVRALMNELQSVDRGVRLAWPQDYLCSPASTCAFATDGAANFYDDGHLTTVGAKRVLPAYAVAFE